MVAKAKGCFAVLERLLTERSFLYSQQLVVPYASFLLYLTEVYSPSSADVILAAHIHILLVAEVPERDISSLLEKQHPRLVEHAQAVLSAAGELTEADVAPIPTFDFSVLLPRWGDVAT